MSNTNNNKKEKAYIVSFGNSDKYLLYDDRRTEESYLLKIENELNKFLHDKFPNDTFAYFTSPRAVEIDIKHVGKYSSYPKLDREAVNNIKEVLVKEVEELEANRRLNSDAPYSKVNPNVAGVRGIL